MWALRTVGAVALATGFLVTAASLGVAPDDSVSAASAVTGMWAWGNPVPSSLDFRGEDEAAFQPAQLAEFARTHSLTDVRLSVPWEAEQGTAIRRALSASVSALHSNRATVAALGGDPGWVDDPALADQWMTQARVVADFDSVQLDVEPWTDSSWVDDATAINRFVTMAAQSEATAHALGMRFGMDLPWWLATKPYRGASILSAILTHVDSISIVAFADHAAGDNGIIALSSEAVGQAAAAGKPFTIGVETDSPVVAGGTQYTLNAAGSMGLESAAATVRLAYRTTPGYSGVTVEHYLSWLALAP
jgi:hypothetical protein